MRHRKKISKLSRTASHRKALMANLAAALIIYKKIRTTTPKAKALRSYVEKLITKARRGDLASRRLVLKYIKQKDVVKELFEEVAPKYVDRPGGYTRITKIGQRTTDAAEMAFIELIGFEGIYKKRKEASDEKRKKRKEKEKEQEKQMQEMEQQAAMEAQAESSSVEEETEPVEKESEESKEDTK